MRNHNLKAQPFRNERWSVAWRLTPLCGDHVTCLAIVLTEGGVNSRTSFAPISERQIVAFLVLMWLHSIQKCRIVIAVVLSSVEITRKIASKVIQVLFRTKQRFSHSNKTNHIFWLELHQHSWVTLDLEAFALLLLLLVAIMAKLHVVNSCKEERECLFCHENVFTWLREWFSLL